MTATEATYATCLHEPCIHVKALGRGKELPFDCGTAGFRCALNAG